jgi:hypothetical protein
LSKLTVVPVKQLMNKRLEAEDFDRLMIGDTTRDLLRWLSDPKGVRDELDQGTWSAFCSRCRQDYGFHPETDGDIVGGEKHGIRDGVWYGVSGTVCGVPALYPGFPNYCGGLSLLV